MLILHHFRNNFLYILEEVKEREKREAEAKAEEEAKKKAEEEARRAQPTPAVSVNSST